MNLLNFNPLSGQDTPKATGSLNPSTQPSPNQQDPFRGNTAFSPQILNFCTELLISLML